MPFSYSAVIFDCDGVICDTETLHNRLFKEALEKLGLTLSEEDLHTHFAGFTTEENLRVAEAFLGRPLPDNFASDIAQKFNQEIATSLQTIEGVREVLEKIKAPIAMATNAQRVSMDYKLKLLGLLERFQNRFCFDDVANPKPAPDMYLAAAQHLGVQPEHCIVIEDSVAGIRAGVAAGMTVLAYSGSMPKQAQLDAGATQCFDHMNELETLLGI